VLVRGWILAGRRDISKRVEKAIVLYSGGLDSTTLLAIARAEGLDTLALVFRYGQRHAVEVEHAASLGATMGARVSIQDIDLRAVGGSALTSDAIDVPRDRPESEMAAAGVPATYVPARNTIFLAFGLAWAEALGAGDIFIGVNALDYSGYPDCRPEYIAAFERMARLATRAGVEGRPLRLRTPLIDKTKAEIIRWGVELGVDHSRTWSCYDPVPLPPGPPAACGRCDSCRLRRKGFLEAGVPDPTRYA
jgi:7-cyano-7-deazaguanine synthase